MTMCGFTDYDVAKEKLTKANFPKGILAFGSARLPMDDSHIKEIKYISELCAKRVLEKNKDISFITGGGPSVMVAWLEPAYKLGIITGGMALDLPKEELSKDEIFYQDKYSHKFKTFAARKAIMFEYAKCMIVFKGGFGTMDELFSALTLMQTKRIPTVPIFVYLASYYKNILNFKSFIDDGTITEKESNMIKLIDTKEELFDCLYKIIDESN